MRRVTSSLVDRIPLKQNVSPVRQWGVIVVVSSSEVKNELERELELPPLLLLSITGSASVD